ncbi:two-component sensor histidine kinase [Clostridium botulinum]|uniref:sensor histidine kinase n=1 Tax=Clostridium TaxID=1485 RepID=UPI001A9130CA|nr:MULTISPECIES: ATP-binding protein [Clostridium]EKO1914155.1 two-component sensor histidine kinase [Clostridium botulinum]EKO2044209.1 two-component sensor histidine kinase [Clostridium botulinum]MBO0525230.1 two-component sensor histidine kinase [Clostridium botulinum]MBO0527557.1 two-component sensor histidine kinase [Clostridium botulinum]MBO0535183.1 two-component sensor histidine kinase [Clostridium botulinum]
MHTIRKRLSILFVICSVAGILLVTLFVNATINKKFDEYMVDVQDKRYERIVSYFEEVYKTQGKWTKNSGVELMHEAHMGNYCLTLLDINKKTIWGMNPNDIRLNTMPVKDRGVYNTKTFEIKSEGKVVGYVDIGQYSSLLLSEEDISFKTSINKSIIASGILTLIIIIAISLYFSKQFSIPIKEVANLSVNLSKGDFDAKSSVESNIEELENLRESVNILAEKLKYQDSLRRRLVSDISHEIRTPLNVLQNNLEAMIDGVFPVTAERLNYLNEEVVRFGRLLNNLNVLKEFESESIKLNFEKIFLDELISDICSDFYAIAENKNIKLQYHIENYEDYSITGDRDKLKQVFINLLSNALKFTEDGGKVLIKLYTSDKNIVVEVKDNGVGIKKEDLPFIFERLYRGDKSRQQFEGNGIGLTIVKNILQLHYASIDLESEEGEGATFKIYFDKNVDN